MKKYRALLLTALILFAFIAGCSSGRMAVLPQAGDRATSNGDSHQMWGLWQFTADPMNQSLDVVQLRNAEFHLNALPFLEPPPLVNLTLESLEFIGNIIETDIGLRHPFLGLTEFTGFDVCGVLVTTGSVSGFDDPDLIMAGGDDLHLVNPDGFTRWWNPAEFPDNGTIFGYTDGILGTPDSLGGYNSTLNGYKYFCNDLGPDDPLDNITLKNRGLFTAGQKNIRHYTIDMGTTGLKFNYAVDANWEFPDGGHPWMAPDDFGVNANRPEPYRISITEVDNSLYNDGDTNGGDLELLIDVYDWFNAGLNNVKIESPGNFTMVSSSTPTGGGTGYSTYSIEILDATPTEVSIDLLFSIECEESGYGGILPGKMVTAYFMRSIPVSGESPSECNPPTEPVLVDPTNPAYLTPMVVDVNNVIHMVYSDKYHIYWSYSDDCGETWVNMGSIYEPTAPLYVHPICLNIACGINEPYLYIAWVEKVEPATGYGDPNVMIGRISISPIGGSLETLKVWERINLYHEYGWMTPQVCVLADDDIMLFGCIRPWTGGNYPMYQFAHDFSDFNMPGEKLLNSHLASGSTIYIYPPYVESMAADSIGSCYLAISGIYNDPSVGGSSDEGTFIIKYDESSDLWDWEYSYNNTTIYYPDNHQTGLYISPDDHVYCASEYQIDGPSGHPNDGGSYYMIFIEGPVGGPYNLTNPIPDHISTVPGEYSDARRDYEYMYINAVADSNGKSYVVYEPCVNQKDAVYITYDGTDWYHTADPVVIDGTMNAYLPSAIRGYEDWVYVSYIDDIGTYSEPYFVAIQD